MQDEDISRKSSEIYIAEFYFNGAVSEKAGLDSADTDDTSLLEDSPQAGSRSASNKAMIIWYFFFKKVSSFLR